MPSNLSLPPWHLPCLKIGLLSGRHLKISEINKKIEFTAGSSGSSGTVLTVALSPHTFLKTIVCLFFTIICSKILLAWQNLRFRETKIAIFIQV